MRKMDLDFYVFEKDNRNEKNTGLKDIIYIEFQVSISNRNRDLMDSTKKILK